MNPPRRELSSLYIPDVFDKTLADGLPRVESFGRPALVSRANHFVQLEQEDALILFASAQKSRVRKNEISEPIQRNLRDQSPQAEFSLYENQNMRLYSRIPSRHEGRTRRHEREAGM